MKLKINKACDLSSISVFPPHTRRSSAPPTGSLASQFRSQPSQQSFSQGLSSQQGMFSQLSQSSQEEALTSDQRVNSQEHENTMKKFSLPPVSYAREESQMAMSRSSTGLMRKWNPASAPDQRSCQISEELERRIGMMETSLNRFGMILDSVQSDVIQVNRATKEVELDVKGICQKLVVHDTSLQMMSKGQEDIKTSLDASLKSLSNQFGKDIYEDRFKEIFLVLSSLPEQIKASLLKLQNDLCNFFMKEMQVTVCSSLKSFIHQCQLATDLSQKAEVADLKSPNQKGQVATVPSQKVPTRLSTRQRKPKPPKNEIVPPEVNLQVPKVEMGVWKSVKKVQPIKETVSNKARKRKGVSSVVQARESRIIIESDEDMDGGFSCLIKEKETDNGNKLIDDVKEETQKILKKARRQRRKQCNLILID